METIEINGETYVKQSDISQVEKPKGDYVVVRTYSAGVHAGYLSSQSEDGKKVTLTNTRRLWYWKGASTLSQVAGSGITDIDSCKFPAAIAELTLTEAIEIIPCTDTAKSIIEGAKEWVQK